MYGWGALEEKAGEGEGRARTPGGINTQSKNHLVVGGQLMIIVFLTFGKPI